jgi:tRNA(fMet)-specific endonuclease VapC
VSPTDTAENGGSRPATVSYLIDTDALSDLVRRPDGPVARHIARVGEDDVFTSVIVAGELRYGAARSTSRILADRVEGLLAAITIAPIRPSVARRYATLRAHLASSGTPIGPNDLWIAAHALALGATVVTRNVREFRRVPHLAVERWTA